MHSNPPYSETVLQDRAAPSFQPMKRHRVPQRCVQL